VPEELQQTAPDTELKRLNRQPRGNPSGAAFALLLGILVIVVGTAIVLMALDVIPTKPGSIRVPRPVFAALGAAFGGAGLLALIIGVRGVRQGIRSRRLIARYPAEPWRADFAWDPAGFTTRARSDVARRMGAELFIVVFLIPFYYWGFHSGVGPLVIGICAVFDLIGLCLVIHAMFLLLRWLKYGDSRLQFESFPFFLGDVLDAVLVTSKDIRGCRRARFTLRCIQERVEITGTGRGQHAIDVCYQTWASAYDVEQPGDIVAGSPVRVTFLLPEDLSLCTALSDRPPQYWEIEVTGVTPGIGYKAQFLVPIYIRPTGAPD
jgi:hypothetical protein